MAALSCYVIMIHLKGRTMIRFLIELLVRRTWFDELYFVLNWLVMRCKLRPELAADSMIENVGCSQYTLIIPHRVIQLLSHSGSPRQGCASHKSTDIFFPPNRVKNLAAPSSIFIFISSSSTGELCSQPVRGNVCRIGRTFLEPVERSFLDHEYSFVAVRRIFPTRFAKALSPFLIGRMFLREPSWKYSAKLFGS